MPRLLTGCWRHAGRVRRHRGRSGCRIRCGLGGGSRVKNTDQQSSPSVPQAPAACQIHARWPSRKSLWKNPASLPGLRAAALSLSRWLRRRCPGPYSTPAPSPDPGSVARRCPVFGFAHFLTSSAKLEQRRWLFAVPDTQSFILRFQHNLVSDLLCGGYPLVQV